MNIQSNRPRPRRAVRKVAALVLLVGLLAAARSGSRRDAVPSRAGGPIEPLDGASVLTATSTATSTRAPTRLRLASFNIHSCINDEDHYDPQLTANTLRGFDLVTLYECRGGGPWWSDNPATLGRLLHMRSAFFSVERWWWHDWFGNGLLTNVRIAHWQTTCLPTGPDMAFRQYNHLELPFGTGTLHILAVHVAKKSDRSGCFQAVETAFLALPTPAILMGDMNTRPNDPLVVDLLTKGVRDAVGEHLTYQRDRVDFIFTRGVRCIDAGLIENGASDHPLVWAEIEAGQP